MKATTAVIVQYAVVEPDGHRYRTCNRDGRNPKAIYPDHVAAELCAKELMRTCGSEPQWAYRCEVDTTHHHLTRRDTRGACACRRTTKGETVDNWTELPDTTQTRELVTDLERRLADAARWLRTAPNDGSHPVEHAQLMRESEMVAAVHVEMVSPSEVKAWFAPHTDAVLYPIVANVFEYATQDLGLSGTIQHFEPGEVLFQLGM
jgi:hypothetical protein